MTASHWDEVYRTRPVDAVSWYQVDPEPSLTLLAGAASVIDVGSGASALVDALVSAGVDVTCLDVSQEALDITRGRLGPAADSVTFIRSDVTTFRPDRQWDAWHDRAVFHFLTDPADQRSYVSTAAAALPRGGRVVLGCFAPAGPDQCSGLEVARHDAEDLARIFQGFSLSHSETRVHVTPWQADQVFTWVTLIRE